MNVIPPPRPDPAPEAEPELSTVDTSSQAPEAPPAVAETPVARIARQPLTEREKLILRRYEEFSRQTWHQQSTGRLVNHIIDRNS